MIKGLVRKNRLKGGEFKSNLDCVGVILISNSGDKSNSDADLLGGAEFHRVDADLVRGCVREKQFLNFPI